MVCGLHAIRLLVLAAILAAPACSVVRAPEPVAPSQGEQLAQLASAQLGAPYRFGGATPQGFDCSGLVRYVFGAAGIIVPRTAAEQLQRAEPVQLNSLQPGDLVFFRIASERIDHVGIYAGQGGFIHAPRSGRPVSRDSLAEAYYQRRFAGAGRYSMAEP
jgi:cell wall-associated NlpC family hydrolase